MHTTPEYAMKLKDKIIITIVPS